MSDLTSKLLAGIKPGVDQLKIYDTRIADMNDAQCRLALLWFLANSPALQGWQAMDTAPIGEEVVVTDGVAVFTATRRSLADAPAVWYLSTDDDFVEYQGFLVQPVRPLIGWQRKPTPPTD